MNEAIKKIDFSILPSTIRTVEEQKKFVENGQSKTMNSKHLKGNDGLSHAVDIWKYPIDWTDIKGQTEIARYILGIADAFYSKGIIKNKISWGGDWNWKDYPHFEIS
jgi:peptidoglycan L-alanyl-D-glutamate endopeptidase CwlK